MPFRFGPQASLDVPGLRARPVPIIPAIVAVLERSLNQSPFPDAETMFTDGDGGRMHGPSATRSIRRIGAENGEPNLPARLRATFADTLAAHPYDDGVVEALCGLERDRYVDPLERPPTPTEIRAAMMRHPLAPYGRIAFFEKGRPDSPLLDEILALAEPRTMGRKERDSLRLRRFKEVHHLWNTFCFDAEQAGKFFGIKATLFVHWAERFEKHGHEGLKDMRSTGIMTLAERTLVLSEYDETKFESWRQFEAHLAQFDLPYGRCTVEALLKEEGFEPPERMRLDAKWRPEVLAAWDASPPKSYQSFHVRLAARGFPYGRNAMQEFLESEGRVVRYRDFLKDPWRAEAIEAARAAQPIANVMAFHRQAESADEPACIPRLPDPRRHRDRAAASEERESRQQARRRPMRRRGDRLPRAGL